MSTKKPTAPKGAGRPRYVEGEAMKSRTYRMTDQQAAKADRLGGAAWIRKQIDKAKE